jgi:hypothetical protein
MLNFSLASTGDFRDSPTLNQVLARLDMWTQTYGDGHMKHIQKDGKIVFSGGAESTWRWLHVTGQHRTDRLPAEKFNTGHSTTEYLYGDSWGD